MTAIRLFVSDIDGTLVRHDKSLSDANVAACRRLTEAGIAMSLISARPPSGMLWIAERLGLAGPFAAFNGGTLFDAGGRLLSAARLDDDVAAGLVSLIGSRCEVWLYAGGRWYAHDGSAPHAQRERKAAGIEPEERADFARLAHAVDKLVAVSDDPGLLDAIQDEAHSPFAARANIVRSQSYYLDFTALSANKGDGVTALAEAFGAPLGEVAVAGDMDNDLPMFARAGLRIAMGQAPAGVRAEADHVSASNDDDGVAAAIDQWLLPAARGVNGTIT